MESLVGKTARVTGRVAAATVGSVVVSVDQGTETYTAFPYDQRSEFLAGAMVTIMEDFGRTVFVA